jgi:sugar phosphate isomerase/epimerase
MSRSVYASTSCIRGPFVSVEAQVAAYHAAGITHVELGWAPRLQAADAASAFRALGGAYLIHNYFPQPDEPFVLNLASQDPIVLGRSREMAAAALRLTAAVGAPFYSVHAGFLAEFRAESLGRALAWDGLVDRATALATFCDSIASLADDAARFGVQLLIEPNVVERRNLVKGENRLLLLADAEEIVATLGRLSRPEVGILLDTGHLNVTATTLRFDRHAFVELVAPWVRGIHVHDNDGTADRHQVPVPGSWVYAVLRRPSFRAVPVVIEAAFDTVDALAAHWRRFSQEMTET